MELVKRVRELADGIWGERAWIDYQLIGNTVYIYNLVTKSRIICRIQGEI